MKRLIGLLLLMLTTVAEAQLYIGNGGGLTIGSGAVLKTTDDISGTGSILVQGTLSMAGAITGVSLDATTGALLFEGTTKQTLPAGMLQSASVYAMTINNTAGLEIGESLQVSNMLSLAAGPLIIGNYNLGVAAITGGSSGSYVKTSGTGTLRIPVAAAATIVFPIGNTGFDPLQITNNAAATEDYAARVLDEVYANGLTGSTVNYSRIKRSWDIDKLTANAATNINLRFSWNADEVLGPLAAPSVYHYYESLWGKLSGSATVNANSLTYNGYSGLFSPFAVMSVEVLPVTLLSFDAQCDRGKTLLSWATATEQNNRHFEVERSSNGIYWERIGTVAGRNSGNREDYTFVDETAMPELHYYRLRQVDLDGKAMYSSVVRTSCGDALPAIRLYPNPATDFLHVKAAKPGSRYMLINQAGVVLKSGFIFEAVQRIDLSGITPGTYFIRIADGINPVSNHPFVIVK